MCLRAVRVSVSLYVRLCVMWSVCTRERGRVCPEPMAVVAKMRGALPASLPVFLDLENPARQLGDPTFVPEPVSQ